MSVRHRFRRSQGRDRSDASGGSRPGAESLAPMSQLREMVDRFCSVFGAGHKWIALLVGICCVTLTLLAYFQIAWIGQVRDTQHETMLNSLRNSMRLFEWSCQRDLSQFLTAFQEELPTNGKDGVQPYLDRYSYWRESFAHSAVVDRVLVYDSPRPGEGQLLELNFAKRRLESSNWSGHLIDLRYRLDEPAFRAAKYDGAQSHSTWVLHLDSSALVRAAPGLGRERTSAGGEGMSEAAVYLIIMLDMHYLSEHLLPEMVDQYFAGPDGEKLYDVAVLVDGGPYFLYRVPRDRSAVSPRDMVAEGGKYFLYRSGNSIDAGWLRAADSRRRLMADVRIPPPTAKHLELTAAGLSGPASANLPDASISLPADVAEPGGSNPDSDGRPHHGLGDATRTQVVLPEGGALALEIVAKHVAGSLERVVLRQQQVDLAMGSGVLLLLAVAMMLVVVASSRAARLAEMRMDFVAGVSHELRTPLSAIGTMGQNMADGLVASREKVVTYGELIRDNAGRLTKMVEETLQLSAIKAGKKRFRLGEVDVASAVAEAVAHARPMIERAGFELVLDESHELPLVRADPDALQQSLTNLLSNALKYGLKGRWVKIETIESMGDGGREVQIRIHDRGEGVPPSEARHIFEPYFRGAAAANSIAPGSGLGLRLARDLVEGMGGKLTLQSEMGRGSVFTIHLLACELMEA